MPRSCVICGGSLLGKRSDSETCGDDCRQALKRRKSEDETTPQTDSEAVKVVLSRVAQDHPHRTWVVEQALSHTVEQLEKREREVERLTTWLMSEDLAELHNNRAFQTWREQQRDRRNAQVRAIMRPPAEQQQNAKRQRLAANTDDEEENS